MLALDFSADGKYLATGGGDPSREGELLIWDVEKNSLFRKIEDAHSDTIQAVKFSRDGKYLLTGSADKFAKIFEVASGKLVRSFEGHAHHVMGVAWKADQSQIATAGADNVIKIWDSRTGDQRRTIAGYAKQVSSVEFLGFRDQHSQLRWRCLRAISQNQQRPKLPPLQRREQTLCTFRVESERSKTPWRKRNLQPYSRVAKQGFSTGGMPRTVS